MNIVEDLANFYRDNQEDILKTLDLKISKTIVFIVDNNKKITSIVKYETVDKGKTQLKSYLFKINDVYDFVDNKTEKKINLTEYERYGRDVDDTWFKTIKINSGYLLDDANNGVCSNNKLISSTISKVFKFRNKKGKFEKKEDNNINHIKNNNLVENYFNSLPNEYDIVFSDIVNNILSNFIDINGYINYKSGDISFVIPKDYDIFIIKQELSELEAIEYYNTYLDSRIYNKKNGSFTTTNGSNSKKKFYNLNIKSKYNNSYLNNNSISDINILKNYTCFINIMKYIPNKFLVIEDRNIYQNIFDISRKNDNDYDDIMKLLYGQENSLLKNKELKILNIQNFQYSYVNISNLKMNYNKINFDKDGYKNELFSRYEIMKEIISVFDSEKNKVFMDLVNSNKDKYINSLYSNHKISLTNILNNIQSDLRLFVYENKKINTVSLYNMVEDFIINNNLLNKTRLYKLTELEFNLTGNNLINNMNSLDIKIDSICGIQTFKNISSLEESLNEIGMDILNSDDKESDVYHNFFKLYQNKKVRDKYLKEDTINHFKIDNIEEYSYLLGVLVYYNKSLSLSLSKSWMDISEYKNNSIKKSIDRYIILSDKFQSNRGESKVFRNLQTNLLEFVVSNQEFDKKIDYIYFNYGINKSTKYIWKSK